VARHEGDFAWPGPVWGVGEREPMTAERKADLIGQLKPLL
jgi:diadenosine tetraphosphate (Ap4A) HIT family hydrolase